IVRYFCVAQKQKGVADAMIEARLWTLTLNRIPEFGSPDESCSYAVKCARKYADSGSNDGLFSHACFLSVSEGLSILVTSFFIGTVRHLLERCGGRIAERIMAGQRLWE